MPNPISLEVYLDDAGQPVCDPPTVTIREAGATVLSWKIRRGAAITGINISGLPTSVFKPQNPGYLPVWTTTDNASASNNGTYKYDVNVQKTDGSTATLDPEITNDIPQ
jgi:hypothetical protein